MKYNVTFYQYHTYEVDADNEDEAIDKAFDDFIDYMRRPTAHTDYDEVKVRKVNEE
jgi:hypothetical protein